MATALGCLPEVIRWEISLAELYRCRHAQLWLDGHRCKRAGQFTHNAHSKRRARIDELCAKYGSVKK